MKVLAIISQKGGAGKTTMAIHLAAAAAAEGVSVLILDTDPQATASQWSQWRRGADPEVVDCGSPTLLPRKIDQARQLGAELLIIDTPPHADMMARAAVTAADLVLIPCRPQAFDLSAVVSTAGFVESTGKPAFVVFNGGPVRAPTTYAEARELIEGADGVKSMGVPVAPVMLTQRAIFHHSTAVGKVASEVEPEGKAAEEVRALWLWTSGHVHLPTDKQDKGRAVA